MIRDQVIFETEAALPQSDPIRMDGACFVGFVAERKPLAAGPALAGWLDRAGYLTAAERPADGPPAPVTLIDRPVPVRSLGEYEALFDGSRRLDQQAEITGLRLPAALAPADVATPLAVVVDGRIEEIDLSGAASPEAAAEAINAARLGVEARLDGTAGQRRLVLALPLSHGPGTLAVLAHPGLGFPLAAHAHARAAGTVLDAAVRQFFAMGGTRAVIVSLGEPLPLFAPAAARESALARLAGLGPVPGGHVMHRLRADDLPPPHIAAAGRSGITHLYGLPEPAMLLLPDLPDLCAADRIPAPPAATLPPTEVAFAECLPAPASPLPASINDVALPESGQTGLGLWTAAVERVLALIGSHRRDMHLLLAVPRPAAETAMRLPESAFLHLAGPFLRTAESGALPGRAMPACAVLAGRIAAKLQGTRPYGSAAADPVEAAIDIAEPPGPRSWPVSWFARGPRGVELTRDISASDDPAWRPGPSTRIAARLVREAGVMGQDLVFEPISMRLMRRVVIGFEQVLTAIAAAGGLRPGDGDPGYDVICDRRTMTAADIDNGTLRAEISFRPAAPIEMIRIVLPLGAAKGGRP